jgi:hypothetical protein
MFIPTLFRAPLLCPPLEHKVIQFFFFVDIVVFAQLYFLNIIRSYLILRPAHSTSPIPMPSLMPSAPVVARTPVL